MDKKHREFFESLPISCNKDIISMGIYKGVAIAAPASFWKADQDLIDEVCGGCGPGGIGDYVVPDTVLFLNVRVACEVHDWCFAVWNYKAGFDKANNVFKNNMIRIIDQRTKWGWLKKHRYKRAYGNYWMVQHCGESFFYDSHLKYLVDK